MPMHWLVSLTLMLQSFARLEISLLGKREMGTDGCGCDEGWGGSLFAVLVHQDRARAQYMFFLRIDVQSCAG